MANMIIKWGGKGLIINDAVESICFKKQHVKNILEKNK